MELPADVDAALSTVGNLVQYGIILILIVFSGVFSGLNLGLMSLTLNDLTIVICSSTGKEAKYARRIFPIRRRGNLLLCTILLGNVSVNALLSILMAGMTEGVIAFLVSTFVIVVFGEIVPQSACSRHALAVGYYSVWFVWGFLVLLLPISYPISKILDLLLGREIGTVYSKEELKKLFDLHASSGNTLTHEETTILAGALDFGSKTVSQVMTPLEKVFMLDIDEVLSGETIARILSEGYSRVPVYQYKPNNIVGLLFVKDLALVNPEDNLPLSRVLDYYGRNFPRVFADTTLSEMLKEFKNGQSHIAAVRRLMSQDSGGDPVYENIGIITLEDVIEEILQQEILDETDIPETRSIAQRSQPVNYEQLRGTLVGDAKNQEWINVACAYLENTDLFHSEVISPTVLRALITNCIMDVAAGTHFIEVGGTIRSMYLVVDGLASCYANNGSHIADVMPGQVIGIEALETDEFIASYSARAIGVLKVVAITRRAYESAKQATALELTQQSISQNPIAPIEIEDDPF